MGEENMSQTVVVLGASIKEERYSNRAVRMLKEYKHKVIPINRVHRFIEGLPVISELSAVTEAVDTLTVYVGPRNVTPLIDDIVNLKPGRVILNPGTESSELKAKLKQAGIPFFEACTLVLLRTGQFDRQLIGKNG